MLDYIVQGERLNTLMARDSEIYNKRLIVFINELLYIAFIMIASHSYYHTSSHSYGGCEREMYIKLWHSVYL